MQLMNFQNHITEERNQRNSIRERACLRMYGGLLWRAWTDMTVPSILALQGRKVGENESRKTAGQRWAFRNVKVGLPNDFH